MCLTSAPTGPVWARANPMGEWAGGAGSKRWGTRRLGGGRVVSGGRRCPGGGGGSLGLSSGPGAWGETGGMSFENFAVRRVLLHTHPTPTGPSSVDFLMLQQTDQRSSWINELFGGGLTRFRGP